MQRGKKRKWNVAAGSKAVEQPAWKTGLKGLVLAWLVTMIGLFIAAALIYWEWLGADLIPPAAKGIMIISMLTGGFYVFKKSRGTERIWVLIMLIGYLAMRFLLSLILTFL